MKLKASTSESERSKTERSGSKKVGCKAVLVKSGKYKELDEKKGRPDLVVNRMMEVFEQLDKKAF